MGVRHQRAGEPHAVGFRRIDDRVDLPRGVDDDALARHRIADEVDEVLHRPEVELFEVDALLTHEFPCYSGRPRQSKRFLPPDLFLDDRPRGPRQVHKLCKMIRRPLPGGAGPGSLHAGDVIPVELDDGVPAWMLPRGIRRDAILNVAAKAGQLFGHCPVLGPHDGLKALGRHVRSSVEDNDELHHALTALHWGGFVGSMSGHGFGPTQSITRPARLSSMIIVTTAPPEFRIAAIACCVPKRTPRTLTSTTRSQRAGSSSGNTSRGVTPASTMPALFTRMSSRPKDAHTSSMILRMPSSFATSPGVVTARPPSCSMSRTLSNATVSSISLTATVAPSRANRRAVARPIPEPPPVTSAIAPLMLIPDSGGRE